MQRHLLGIIAVVLFGCGIAMLQQFGNADSQYSMMASACLRTGLLLGAVWLAYNQVARLIGRMSWPAVGLTVVAGLVVVFSKRAIVILPALAALVLLHLLGYFTRPKAPQTRSNKRPSSKS